MGAARRSPMMRRNFPLLSAAFVLIVGEAIWSGRSLRSPPRWLLATGTQVKEPETATAKGDDVGECHTIKADMLLSARVAIERWENKANVGQPIFRYGKRSTKLLNETLKKFDTAASKATVTDACAAERRELETSLKNQLHAIYSAQCSTIEQQLYQKLRKNLLGKLRRKKGELSVKEKLKLLHAAMDEYDSQVMDLKPGFVTDSGHDRVERRLSELQWGIEKTPEAKEMMNRWQQAKLRRSTGMRKLQAPTLSLSPGLRLMFRPTSMGGLGTTQFFSRREVGPAHNPAEISVGYLNDGKVADIYNNQNNPPLAKWQPVLNLELRFG